MEDTLSSASESSLELLTTSHDDSIATNGSSEDSSSLNASQSPKEFRVRSYRFSHDAQVRRPLPQLIGTADEEQSWNRYEGGGVSNQMRGFELGSVQLEVTMMLLESEKKRLLMLQRELEKCLSQPAALKGGMSVDFLRENIERLQDHYGHLDEEYRVACKGAFIRRSQMVNKSSRSQPAIGVKQMPKARVSTSLHSLIFVR